MALGPTDRGTNALHLPGRPGRGCCIATTCIGGICVIFLSRNLHSRFLSCGLAPVVDPVRRSFWFTAYEVRSIRLWVPLFVDHVRVAAALIVVFGAGIANALGAAHAQPLVADMAPGARAATARDTYDFDIPSLALSDALARYGELTGYSVLYETSVAIGKRSSVVQGQYTAEAALDRLLLDTELTARFVNRRSVMLTAPPAPAPRTAGEPTPSMAQRRYDGYLQRRIAQTLCADSRIGAGRYRIALRFSVGADQRLHQVRVRVAEHPELEPIVQAALAASRVEAPPADVAQEVVIIVSPEAARRYGGCPP